MSKSESNGVGRIVTYTYSDGRGLASSHEGGRGFAGPITTFTYGEGGRLIKWTDHEGRITTMLCDAGHSFLGLMLPDGTVVAERKADRGEREEA